MAVKFITVGNKKGGAGKTASAVNIACQFALNGFNVLLVDLDEQGNAGSAFIYDESKHQNEVLESVFEGKASLLESISVVEDLPNLNVARNGRNLESTILPIAAKRPSFVYSLRAFFKSVESAYDYIIFDTAPNFQPLTQAALLAADKIIVPLMDANGVDALKDVYELVQSSESILKQPVEIRPLFTRANVKANAFKEVKNEVENKLGFAPYTTPIPIDENHNKAQVTITPVVLMKTKIPSKAQVAYSSLAKEIQNG